MRHGLGGALRGRSPRTREGRLGPTAQNCSGQWLVASDQRRDNLLLRVEREIGAASLLPKVQGSSSFFWDAPVISGCFDPIGALVYYS